ncbi:hypothetical protein C9374_003691 [Naegleria lovaniensis]|uniref:Uncharacterized protein n=1 Tax=Naegleria lovaniensis TaxID=51637 RepID=A0AA88H842_NAELO|nr:uncharacterized protein C9374_003691 [Naegleria lovaniensis]KAG2393927.1 hypothetical protein C9374_003691 [Naegleria lovaniensis]
MDQQPTILQNSTRVGQDRALNNYFFLDRTSSHVYIKNPEPLMQRGDVENINLFLNDDNVDHNDIQDDELLDILNSETTQERQESKEEFEEKKRKLLILLDQAVEAKMKVSKAFPEKLAMFGDNLSRFNLNWHPGWREPERFIPDIDCDPYRGACSVSSCACQMFQSWPVGEQGNELYVYNPKIVNPESELCRECHHLKSDHYLATKADKTKLKEFSPENMEKYAIQVSDDIPPKHPSEIPTHFLSRFYEENPIHPGASPNVNKLKLLEETEANDKKKRMSSMDVDDGLEDEDDPLADEL